MLYFYYGEDTYSLKKKIREIVDAFVKIEGSDFNVSTISGSKITVQDFEKNVFTAPFLGNRRLVLINNFLIECSDLDVKKTISAELAKIPENCIVIFADAGKPDKRESIFKNMSKIAKTTAFEAPSDLSVKKFIEQKVAAEGIAIDSKATFNLAIYCGADYWRIENEISKLASFVKFKNRDSISEDDVRLLVEQNNSFIIFDLTDAIAARDVRRAINIYHSMLEGGEDQVMVFNMIIAHIRNMVMVSSVSQSREAEIAEMTGLKPFVVKKIMYSVGKFDKPKLYQLYKKLSEIDWNIKSGVLDIGVALDLLLVDFQRS